MAASSELHDRLMAHARAYDASAHHRSLLGPYREVLLLWRAKYMSYEQIAATLREHGLVVSPTGVGVFCRRHLTKTEIEQVRRDERGRKTTSSPVESPVAGPLAASVPRRGPKIARDNY